MKRFFVFLTLLNAALLLCGAAETPASATLDEARTAMNAGNFAKAAALLEPLTGADGKDAAAFDALSQVRLAQKNTVEAIALAEKATALDATKPAYFSQLGAALSQRMGEVGFMKQAMIGGKLRKAFAKSVELDPNNVSGLIGLARCYTYAPAFACGSTEKARGYALRVRALAPFTGEFELANIAERDENYAEAFAHYDAATKLNPNHGWAQYLCGRSLEKLGRKDEARMRFEAALKIDPQIEAAKESLRAILKPNNP